MKSKTIKRLLGYLENYRVSLAFVMLFAIISTIFTVVAPDIMGKITTALYEGVSTGEFNGELILSLLGILILIYLLGSLFSMFQARGMAKITAKAMQRLRNDINTKMHRMKLNYYDTKTNGEILSVITNDVDTLSNTISQSLTSIVTQLITAIGIFLMMLKISKVLTIIAVVMVPLSLIASMGVIKASGKSFGEQQEKIGKINGFIEEMYNGQYVVQAFNYQDRAIEQFEAINQSLCQSAKAAEISSGAVTPIITLINNFGYVISAALGCLFALNGQMTIGNIQSMLQYTKNFSQPFTSIAGMAGSLGAALAAGNRIFELLDAEEEIPDPEQGTVPAVKTGTVEFQHVAFGYTPDNLLMTDVNIKVEAGQKVAIVGPTGAGKTTLINLLMRFYEVNSGKIIVDGVDTKAMTRKELRSHFGMVLQDTWLFEGTIEDNLRYGKNGLSHDDIVTAAKSACADGFIRTLPNSYAMMLSKGAENISQGERQLLTIARAIASDPEIMILDEATSNVDTHTELIIQTAMARLMKGRTSFVIAHRLSTIRDADMILYMENGDIKEAGNHDTLMKLNGKYAVLYNSQFA